MKYILGLGSNLGRRQQNLTQACRLLEEAGVKILKISSLYKTQPVGLKKQPWFYNQVIQVVTPLDPFTLLSLAKEIEIKLKRKKTVRYGPRTLDIDLLMAGKMIIKSDKLTIPHPKMHERRFVLEPLNEIAPNLLHPIKRKKIKTLLKEIKDNSIVLKLEKTDKKVN
ncbi:MAG: 2-amino-4-hydroxy-6-hydroxymethyldihydropteridine diphosphokinase [Candidatus Aminicenantes bacterium]|nr:2-amino-4-hydroxy-6-hydroxymethyldihydropteridine diphosphokinase [Candidatus Aminicenantes bacterium]